MRMPFALEPTALNLLPSGRVVCSETSVQVPTTCCFSWATALLETNASAKTLDAEMLRMLRRFIVFLLRLRAKRAHETHGCSVDLSRQKRKCRCVIVWCQPTAQWLPIHPNGKLGTSRFQGNSSIIYTNPCS